MIFNQEIIEEYLVVSSDTLDIFSYQIPAGYDSANSHTLLVAFHQWGGNHNSTYDTQFDEEANDRNWFYLSPFGGASNNYNHQGAQYFFQQEIIWMAEHYNIDKKRIYFVGGSMGGAAGAVFSNNHLDPTMPMVAATASASGILDCERRAIEMDGNNSMTEWFGGNWDEVPFEYHRNSAVYFADSTQSMHYNLQYLPLYFDFGVSEPHRTHAEELFSLLTDYNEYMWIDENPTGSHGFSVIDEHHACEWLSQYELFDNPEFININLDEPSRAYWIEALNQADSLEFLRIIASKDTEGYSINNLNNTDTILIYLEDEYTQDLSLNIFETSPFTLGFIATWLENITQVELSQDGIILDCHYLNGDTLWVTCVEMGEYNLSFAYSYFGDINGDGAVNILDLVLISNLILDSGYNAVADFNQDGLVNILDLVQIANYILEN